MASTKLLLEVDCELRSRDQEIDKLKEVLKDCFDDFKASVEEKQLSISKLDFLATRLMYYEEIIKSLK